MENKNNGLKLIIVFLTALVIGLGGFIVYDKVLQVEDDKCKEEADKVDVESDMNVELNTDDIVDAAYDTVIFTSNNNVYYVTSYNEEYFDNAEVIQVKNVNFEVSKVRLFMVGMDASVAPLIVSKDGNVYQVNQNNEAVIVSALEGHNVLDIKDVVAEYENEELVRRYVVVLSDNTEKTITVNE